MRLRHVLEPDDRLVVDHPGEHRCPESGVIPGRLERPVEVEPYVVAVLDVPACQQEMSTHLLRGRPERVERAVEQRCHLCLVADEPQPIGQVENPLGRLRRARRRQP